MEAVLSGVSAGVIGLDSAGSHHARLSAPRTLLLGLSDEELVGKKLTEAIPMFAAVLEKERRAHGLKGQLARGGDH